MLIDFSVFEITDIVEMLEFEEEFSSRFQEAVELMYPGSNQN